MARPNHAFEKRQREIAKAKKKEEKARRKAERKGEGTAGETPAAPESTDSEKPPE